MSSSTNQQIEPEDDRDILTISLTRDELMVALNPMLTKKQKNLRIHRMRTRRRRAEREQQLFADSHPGL